MITASVVEDSISSAGVRVTTLQLRYARYIHSEVMTHRCFSRSASSSRAIPVKKIIAEAEHNPVKPSEWGKNQKGMQAEENIDAATARKAESIWLLGRDAAVMTAKGLMELGVHKQIANRVLEPFTRISVIITATEWDNFFALRDHKDAQPEMAQLARKMREAMDASTPVPVGKFEWHLPYVRPEDLDAVEAYAEAKWKDNVGGVHHLYNDVKDFADYAATAISAARCARVSYNTHDGERPEIEADLNLAERLRSSKHMSPFEHQVTPCGGTDFHANMRGFITFRSLIERMEAQEAEQAVSEQEFFQRLHDAGFDVRRFRPH